MSGQISKWEDRSIKTLKKIIILYFKVAFRDLGRVLSDSNWNNYHDKAQIECDDSIVKAAMLMA